MALTFFGDLERRLDDLYAYRYPLTAMFGLAILIAVLVLLRLGAYRLAVRLKSAIPVASLVEVPSKSISLTEHLRATRGSIAQFLQQHSKALL